MDQYVIGAYAEFFEELCQSLDSTGISVASFSISHLCYRVATLPEYESKREALKAFSRSFVETDFNGRPVSMFLLKSPLPLSDTHAASLIELPAPRAAHTYSTGLEHAGFVVGESLPVFHQRHRDVLAGVKDRGVDQIPFITLPDGKTAKFYDRPLLEIVQRAGWNFMIL